MANWKKIIVSGSGAHLASITASNLTDNRLLVGGTNGLIENSAITFDGTSLTGVTNFTNSGTVAGSSITGSFTGSFVGDGSGLTGTGLDIDALSGGSEIVAGDKIVYSDSGTEKSLTFAILSGSIIDTIAGDVNVNAAGASTISNSATGSILSTISGDVNVTAAGVSTIQANAVEGTMLNSNVAGSGITIISNALTVDSGSMMPFISSSVFSTVSGDITISAGGVATIGANTVDGSKLTDSITIAQDLTVTGDLTVNGTTTTVATTNLLVEDKFILLASGSSGAASEGGIIIDEGSGTGVGYIYETDSGVDRWGFNASVAQDATTANTNAYVAAIIDENNSNHTGGVSGSYVKNGNIRIAANGDIFIYS